MSLIVALETSDSVIVGADSQGTGANCLDYYQEPKIKRIGDFIIGATGSYRLIQVVHSLKFPRYTPKQVLTKIKKSTDECLSKDGDLLGHIILAYRNQVWIIQEDFSMLQSVRGYCAIGSGSEYALGSLYSTRNQKDSENRIRDALKAASEFCPSVGGDFLILKTEK